MHLLDLYSCQGGATRGYQQAGFTVHGVDIDDQPRYCGDAFTQADVIRFLADNMDWIRATFAFVHASPPCQFDSDCQRIMGREHPDLIEPTRELLDETGLPYVIENVSGATPKLKQPVELCGLMFGMDRTYRHRYFEAGGGWTTPAARSPRTPEAPGQAGPPRPQRRSHPGHRQLLRRRHRARRMGRAVDEPRRHPRSDPPGLRPLDRRAVARPARHRHRGLAASPPAPAREKTP